MKRRPNLIHPYLIISISTSELEWPSRHHVIISYHHLLNHGRVEEELLLRSFDNLLLHRTLRHEAVDVDRLRLPDAVGAVHRLSRTVTAREIEITPSEIGITASEIDITESEIEITPSEIEVTKRGIEIKEREIEISE
ncbi:MAG: hypothetical protein SGPRY_003479 [Prymnesium sp.]